MREIENFETAVHLPDNCINKQDNIQRTSQANSQSIVLNFRDNQCQGSTLTVFVVDKEQRPQSCRVKLLWGGQLIAAAISDHNGCVNFPKLPCGFYTVQVKETEIRNLKLLGNEQKEIYLVL